MPHRNIVQVFLATIQVFTLFSSNVYAEQSGSISATPSISVTEKKSLVGLEAGFSSIDANVSSASTVDMGLTYKYALSPKFAAKIALGQGLNSSGFGTIFTEFSGGLSWAFRGRHIHKNYVSEIDGFKISEVDFQTPPALMFNAMAKQIFLNGTDEVIPLVGVSLSAIYQIPSSTQTVFSTGAMYDTGQNEDRTYTAIKLFFGASLWM